MKRIVDGLRSGGFITEDRLKLWPAAFLAGFTIALCFLLATSHGLNDYKGRPLGTDYSNVYAAGVLANKGHAAAPFDLVRQYGQEKAIFGSATPIYGWHYPPFFLLLAAPLARLPYLDSLVLWQVVTLLCYLAALGCQLRKENRFVSSNPLWILVALAFPAVFVNIIHGHNGFLTAALLTAGISFIDERPRLSGIAFGLLAYKPQFAFMIPVVLIATGRSKTLLATVLTVVSLGLVVTLCFGMAVWPAFLASMHFTRTVVLEQGNTGFNKIQSIFAWVRIWGGSVGLAYLVQIAVTMLVGILLVLIWRRPAAHAYRSAALCLGILLSTPYCLDYDLMVLAPAIALMAARGLKQGFAPYEKTLLAALWLVPAVTRVVAAETMIPLAVPSMLCTFAMIAYRVLRAQAYQGEATPSSQAISLTGAAAGSP